MSPQSRRTIELAVVIAVVVGGVGIVEYFEIFKPSADDHVTVHFGEEPLAPFSVENPPSPENFSPRRVVSEQPVVTGFQIFSADEAARALDDDELVLGVVVGGEARAYPINVMTGPQREIFNDTLGNRPIAATW